MYDVKPMYDVRGTMYASLIIEVFSVIGESYILHLTSYIIPLSIKNKKDTLPASFRYFYKSKIISSRLWQQEISLMQLPYWVFVVRGL
jgi:hypothetical protein